MSKGFIHSEKVPRLYKTAATIVKRVTEDGESLKQLIYDKKHPNVKALYALGTTTLQHATELNEIVRKTQLFYKEPRLDPWLARVLITELFWGKQSIKSTAKPIKTILTYENELREKLKNIDKISPNLSTTKKAGKPRYIRINTLQISIDEAVNKFNNEGYTLLPKSKNYSDFLTNLRQLSEYTYIQDFHIPELFAFAPKTQFHDHPGYHSGAIVLQDKASCLPAHLLNPPTNSTILDMCAAPGMKTTHLAAKIQNKGKIYSIEMNERRYSVLRDLVKSTSAYCVKTINSDAMNLSPNDCPDVEYILVDPSCSGSGMERLECEPTQSKCAPLRLKSLQSFQVLLLRHALFTFTNAKRVVYSTCSIYSEENEMVIDEILTDIGDAYELVPIKSLLNNEWLNFSSTEFKCKDKCLYAKPDTDMSNGFFVAVFQRNFDIPLPEYKRYKGMKRDNLDVNENAVIAEEPRKKKKKENFVDESTKKDETNSDLIENVEILNDSVEEKKKKKKSSKKLLQNDDENPDIDDDKLMKKKKKKKLREQLLSKNEENTNIDDDELAKKKEELLLVNEENSNIDNGELVKKKKKKIKIKK